MKLRTIVMAVPLLMLAACGDNGPSESDVKEAYDSFLQSMLGSRSPGVHSVSRVSCSKVLDAVYNCSFSYLLNNSEQKDHQGRFEKAGSDWKYRPLR